MRRAIRSSIPVPSVPQPKTTDQAELTEERDIQSTSSALGSLSASLSGSGLVQRVQQNSSIQCDTEQRLQNRIKILLEQLKIVKACTARGVHFIATAGDLYRLLVSELHHCTQELKQKFLQSEKEIKQLTRAESIVDQDNGLNTELAVSFEQFKQEVRTKLESTKRQQSAIGDLLLELHSALQPA